ncbi:Hsp70 protein-domain-containing protein [Flagelloscypha sp. PMI_526]|nr:Hsp70 protein-domain-containing protein [Flagelloscypha sp. PMI_526]
MLTSTSWIFFGPVFSCYFLEFQSLVQMALADLNLSRTAISLPPTSTTLSDKSSKTPMTFWLCIALDIAYGGQKMVSGLRDLTGFNIVGATFDVPSRRRVHFNIRDMPLVVLAGVIKTGHSASFGNSWANRRRIFSLLLLQCIHFLFKDINKTGEPYVKVGYPGEKEYFPPKEFSSMVLAKTKETSESIRGGTVSSAVITATICFNDSQRQAARDAGIIISGKRNVLVFDLGGASFDVFLLTIEEGVFEVRATPGDTYLGGEDLDNCLVNRFVHGFKCKHNKDPSNPCALCPLCTTWERAERTSSLAAQTSIEVDSLFEGVAFYTSLARARFKDLCHGLFNSTLNLVEKIKLGGYIRIPRIIKLVSNFSGKELSKSINPDEAIDYGPAIQAAILSGDTFSCSMCPLFPLFELSGIPPAPHSGPQIEVVFDIENGIPNVSANVSTTDKSTGKSNRIIVINDNGRLLKEEIERIVSEAKKYKVRFPTDKTELYPAVNEAIQWLERSREASKKEYEESQKVLPSFSGGAPNGFLGDIPGGASHEGGFLSRRLTKLVSVAPTVELSC